jgi:hypothetical protein
MFGCELLLVSIWLRWSFSFSAFLVAVMLEASRARFDTRPEAVALFLLAGAGASASTSDAASGLVLPERGTRVTNPRSFSSRAWS